jgi:hypothetical protein
MPVGSVHVSTVVRALEAHLRRALAGEAPSERGEVAHREEVRSLQQCHKAQVPVCESERRRPLRSPSPIDRSSAQVLAREERPLHDGEADVGHGSGAGAHSR